MFELKERPDFKVGDFVSHKEGYGPYRILAPTPRLGGWQDECDGHDGQTHLIWTTQDIKTGRVRMWCDSTFILIDPVPVDEVLMAARLKAFREREGEQDAKEMYGI